MDTVTSVVATLKSFKNQSKTCETVSYCIVFQVLCMFGNPTFLNSISQLPYEGYVANGITKTMLEKGYLAKKTFT